MTLEEMLALEARIYVAMAEIEFELKEWYYSWVYHHNMIEFEYEGWLALSRGPLGMVRS